MPLPTSIASLLAVLAIALPFLFAWTQAPLSNFWPLMATATCAWVLAVIAWARCGRPGPRHAAGGTPHEHLVRLLAGGLVLAGTVAAVIGLVQFFQGDVGWSPWVFAATPGQAPGNLRQRNQQATLLMMGLWALLWWRARQPAGGDGHRDGHGNRRGDWRGVLAMVAGGLMAVSAAATASRTGALEWFVLGMLVLCWRRSLGARALGWAAGALLAYAAACAALPLLLHWWTGLETNSLFARVTGEMPLCASRRSLWSNMLHLIALRPWTGWGWGDLGYAHYVTLFPGERFCALLDNAHNLPLHLAVELGLPAALLLCGLALFATLRARPWAEARPARQLAWGVLALIGLHSLLEFPLWYGPFQLAAGLAVLLLCPWPGAAARARHAAWWRAGGAVLGAGALALGAWVAIDYVRVSQLYRPAADRLATYRDDTAALVARQVTFFKGTAEFAALTTTEVNARNAAQLNPLARRLLHYSPEPRVIEPLIASARLLDLPAEVAFHTERYRAAYPQDFARWQQARAAAAASTPVASSASATKKPLR
ncbi:Wzy polymerase domain-containing protein [Acidovorax sp. FG27]|uniref:Wzy polymerase domain-containing protein n=1 Tax=Acidovorax sp. FG27 TaxID=3133652 RepID=UPI0030E93D87